MFKKIIYGANVESIDDNQNAPKKMHHCSKWKISTAFNIQIQNAQWKIPSISFPKLHKFQNSQASQKKFILRILSSLQNNIEALEMVFCLHLGENVLIMLEAICHRNKMYYSH